MLTPELMRKLRSVDTPTICNALEFAMGGRSAQGFTYRTLIAAPMPLPAMVGYARTARIRARAPSQRPAGEVRQTRLDYYHYVAARVDVPTIVVMQDLDERPGIGALEQALKTAEDIH